MSVAILIGSSNYALAEEVAKKLGVELAPRILERFPDGELNIEIQQSVRGCDVYLIETTCPPVDEHFFELFLMADACRRAGATHLTAVIPYFGYARQDRRAHGREPVSLRLLADLIAASGLQRVVVVDFHSPAVESAFAIPVEHVSAVSLLADAVRPSVHKDAVVVPLILAPSKWPSITPGCLVCQWRLFIKHASAAPKSPSNASAAMFVTEK
jgi:ribose-phosphate pyrophosphokinase